MIPSMTDATKDVQGIVGREDTLKLIRRAGEIAIASKKSIPPIAALMVFKQRLDKGQKTKTLLSIPTNKMIKLSRTYFNRETGLQQQAELQQKREELLAKFAVQPEEQPQEPTVQE